MTTHEKALEAGAQIEAEWDGRDFIVLGRADKKRYMSRLEAAITAYLSALLPEDAAGLVERLREGTFGSDITKTDPYLNGIMREAASLIQSQAARIAALEEELRRADAYQRRTIQTVSFLSTKDRQP